VTPGIQFTRKDGHDAHAHLVENHSFADSAFGRVSKIGIEGVHMHGPRLTNNLWRGPQNNEARVIHLDEKRLQGRVPAQPLRHRPQKAFFLGAVAEQDAIRFIIITSLP